MRRSFRREFDVLRHDPEIIKVEEVPALYWQGSCCQCVVSYRMQHSCKITLLGITVSDPYYAHS
jgi:hypothetical protein